MVSRLAGFAGSRGYGFSGSIGDPAPRKVILELQQALAHAIERFRAMDEAGVLSHVSDHYRTDPLTKAAIREELRVMFALYDTLRA